MLYTRWEARFFLWWFLIPQMAKYWLNRVGLRDWFYHVSKNWFTFNSGIPPLVHRMRWASIDGGLARSLRLSKPHLAPHLGPKMGDRMGYPIPMPTFPRKRTVKASNFRYPISDMFLFPLQSFESPDHDFSRFPILWFLIKIERFL